MNKYSSRENFKTIEDENISRFICIIRYMRICRSQEILMLRSFLCNILNFTVSKNLNSISPPKDNLIDGALGKRSVEEKIVRKISPSISF